MKQQQKMRDLKIAEKEKKKGEAMK